MNKEQLSKRFKGLAQTVSDIREMLDDYSQFLDNEIDRHAASNILTDLAWAAENLTVLSLHQEGKALEDTMGL